MKNEKLIYQLFIGKVADELGTTKTTKLLKEAREVIETANPVNIGVGDIISRLSDKTLDSIIHELDEYSQNYNQYDYGLPSFEKEHMDAMRNIIKVKLNGL